MLETTLCSDEQNHWNELDWKYAHPFIMLWNIHKDDIDHYKHANNTAYVKQLEKLAWAHSNHLGLSFSDYEEHDRAMVIQHHSLYYLAPSFEEEAIACATWITKCDKRFRLQREFQFISTTSHKTIFAATTDFVCVKLSSGTPKPMPQAFIDVYGAHVIEQ
ncbi:thioesterase family protein [Glaciecola sp. XM2]|jgi:acyl-CoA thioester hydrolase|uniref:acyl-CoA thioesterase n=1 Tax=Glaciecola sp. XM2 TaxID=1914931 RepID=UPI001BDEE998|nr:thioesterase family protein [Glaciecola sp. XM2]MBT1450965.1 thioesterase family protein [Glaciecola sp. XM2]